MRISQKHQKESITFNRGTLMDQDSIKAAPRGSKNRDQMFQKPLQGIKPNQMSKALASVPVNDFVQ